MPESLSLFGLKFLLLFNLLGKYKGRIKRRGFFKKIKIN